MISCFEYLLGFDLASSVFEYVEDQASITSNNLRAIEQIKDFLNETRRINNHFGRTECVQAYDYRRRENKQAKCFKEGITEVSV